VGFTDEIVPVAVRVAGPADSAADDAMRRTEGIRMDATLEGIAGGSCCARRRITAASASRICDGASGVLVVNERGLKTLGASPLARIAT
jgi:acetyl-CoA C-acetyltransferase